MAGQYEPSSTCTNRDSCQVSDSTAVASESDNGNPWHGKTVLSLDGGGIRGIGTLYLLEALLEEIQDLERHHPDGSHSSSFESGKHGETSALRKGFLLCHYFDYICGTSAGGLIAIAIGRLQMTLSEVTNLFDHMGNEVFAKPRYPFLPRRAKLFAHRYSSRRMKRAIIRALVEGAPLHAQEAKETPLKNENADATKVFVTAWGGKNVRERHLFRSYDYPPIDAAPEYGRSQHLPVHRAFEAPLWQAAQATSAAPTYFPPVCIQDELFWDGAIGEDCNNPVRLAYEEVRELHHEEPAVMASFGTGKRRRKPSTAHTSDLRMNFSVLKDMRRSITNSEGSHLRFSEHIGMVNQIQRLQGRNEIMYMRFNLPADVGPEGISNLSLDEWQPQAGGQDTKNKIRTAAMKYLETETRAELRKLASMLVHKRRLRATTSKWKNFAACRASETSSEG